MKAVKIPGLGNYGHYIDDVDFDHMTDEEWMEIGRFHLTDLVTILRNVKMSKDHFYNRIPQWGPPKSIVRAQLIKKYGKEFDVTNLDLNSIVDEDDRLYLQRKKYLLEETEEGHYVSRVTGKRDENGNPLGVFDSGELGWHSNESGVLIFSPGVALLGSEYMRESCTGFVQTVDTYESFSESFRSELDEMIVIHRYQPGKVNANELDDPQFAASVKRSFCPEDEMLVPLVMRSPGGLKGLHYTINSTAAIRGMSDEESARIFKILDDALFTEQNIYDHWYQQDNDLLLFDNSITLHRRLGGQPDRLAYRMTTEYSNLLDTPWYPYIQPEFAEEYKKQIHEKVDLLNLKDFKLP